MFNSRDALFGKREEFAQKEQKDKEQKDMKEPRDNKVYGTMPRSLTAAAHTAPAPASVETDTGTPTPTVTSGSKLIVGPDIKLKGVEITDCDTLVVEGRVEASMDSRVIQIAEHGVYSGTVGIDVAEIYGRFEGELTARKQLVIHATGRVSGTIRYGKLTVEDGGEISGDIRTLSGAAPATAHKTVGHETAVDIMTPYDPFAHKGKTGAKGVPTASTTASGSH